MLLDDTPTMLGEKFALSNINSLRSYEVVDEVKEALEKVCPGIVSCADIIIMASRDAVAFVSSSRFFYLCLDDRKFLWRFVFLSLYKCLLDFSLSILLLYPP